jgi:hypothetical protein
MNLKSEITLKVAQILNLAIDEKSLKTYKTKWWTNPRDKSKGGLQLNDQGFLYFEQAEIKNHKIKLEPKLELTNQIAIKLDQFIDCPWYIHRNHIYVYSEKMAVQLVLFSGNLQRFIEAKMKANHAN